MAQLNDMDSNVKLQERCEWVELLEPGSQKVIFANLVSGEVRWDSPPNAEVRPLAQEQWWELFDVNTHRHYYHNVRTSKTEWHRPSTGDIIPLSKLQLIKQLANPDSSTVDRDIGMMHRHKMPPSMGRNSIHMTPQADHRKTPAPSLGGGGTPSTGRHQLSSTGYREPGESHRRRNSQPTTPRSSQSGAKRDVVSPSSAAASSSSTINTSANQRVTEWLRSAGSLREEAEDDASPRRVPPDTRTPITTGSTTHPSGMSPALPTNPRTPNMRWSTTSANTTNRAPAASPCPPVQQHHFFPAAAAVHPPPPPPPPSSHQIGSAVTYDRRRTAVAPAQLHHQPAQESNTNNAFANLLYDMSCNVMCGLSLANSNNINALPHNHRANTAAMVAGTMPRLAAPAISQMRGNGLLVEPEQQPSQSVNALRTPEMPITTGGEEAGGRGGDDADGDEEEGDVSYSDTWSSSEPEDSRGPLVNNVEKTEDIFEQHPFRPNPVAPVDEYTYTLDRQPPPQQLHQQPTPQQQTPLFQAAAMAQHRQLIAETQSWAMQHQLMQHHPPQSQHLANTNNVNAGGLSDADLCQAPPTPPPRLASAMNTMRTGGGQFMQSPQQIPQMMMMTGMAGAPLGMEQQGVWQTFDPSPNPGFLPRGHPFRQPMMMKHSKHSQGGSLTMTTTASAEDDVLSEDRQPLTTTHHTSTRSLLSASSSLQETATGPGAVGGTIGTVHSSSGVVGTSNSSTTNQQQQLVPRRSASGGFIGPAEMEPLNSNTNTHYSNNSSLCAASVSTKPMTLTTVACSGSTHFALISGPYCWPKDLLRPSQDNNASLMSWTKAAFTKRLLAATDKTLQKHIPANFKLIQSFMGDRAAKLSKPDLASIIVQRALATPGVRDELYAQLCKQTTGNYNADSLMRGWELLCICLFYFPPNKVFRDPLHAYLSARCEALSISSIAPPPGGDPDPVTQLSSVAAPACRPGPSLAAAAALAAGSDPSTLISTPVTPAFGVPLTNGSSHGLSSQDTDGVSVDTASVAGLDQMSMTTMSVGGAPSEFPYGPWVKLSALHFTRAAPRWFMRSVAVGPSRLPMPLAKEDLLHVKDFLLKPGIFGSSLEEMMKIQTCRFSTLRLPWIQVFLTEELLRLKGATAEGIFRVSAEQDILTSARFQLEKLFEVFRVVEVVGGPREPNHPPVSNFAIIRPPPPGWSNSQVIFSPEPPTSSTASVTSLRTSQVDCPALTGPFELPLKPCHIPQRPAEFMLLTPRSLWPADLAGFDESLSTTTTASTMNSVYADPHLAAALLKLWLREMATPLIPPALASEVSVAAMHADAYEKSGGSGSGDGKQIARCCAMVRRLPPTNRRVLLYLIKLCQHLVLPENSSTSLMDSRNLATVIAPNLFRSTTNNPSEMLNSVQSQTAFVRILVTHLNVDDEADLLNSEESTATIHSSISLSSSHSR